MKHDLKIRFGTDGWRGIVGREYTYENVRYVIQAFADDLKSRTSDLASLRPVVLGYDRRFAALEFAKEAAQVLAGNGIQVLLSEQFCSTPCVSWMTRETVAPAGIMITASHNPYQWNGVKFKEGYGGSASLEWTQKVEELIQRNFLESKTPLTVSFDKAVQKGIVRFFSIEKYIEQLAKMVDLEKIRQSSLKIVADAIYGSGSNCFKKVLGESVSVVEIRSEENPAFGGVNPEPIEKNLQLLMETVRQKKADIGLATDGDADRIGAVDENGNFVDSQQIFSLILYHLASYRQKKGDVITTVSATQRIRKICEKYHLRFFETAIGFKHICQKFLETNPLIGGEESGGIGIAEHLYERDGLLSGLVLLEILAVHQKPLSVLLDDLQKEFGPLYFVREDLHLSPEKMEKIKLELKEKDQTELNGKKIIRLNRLDGHKFIFEDESWLLIRPSGTEPLLRLYAESADFNDAKKLIQFAKEWMLGV